MNAGPASPQATAPVADRLERMLPQEVAEKRLTFADVLGRRRGDQHPGLLFEDVSYTWAQVVAECEARAALLHRLRRPGRPFHVGVLLENVPDYIFLLGGASLCGATIIGINPTRRGAGLAADIRGVDCDLIITDSAQRSMLEGLDTGVEPDRILSIDDSSWGHAVREAAASALPEIDDAHDPSTTLLLTFTSGSTGAPKAVICSTGRLASLAAINHLSFTRSDVTYNSMPLFHGNAIMSCWAPSVFTGATFSMRRKFSASGFLPDVLEFGATFFNYVGRSLAYILATPESPQEQQTRLRLVFGTEASPHDRDEFARRYGTRPVESYGSSEGAVVISLTPDSPRNSLGLPPEFMDVCILDGEGDECPRAEFDTHGRLLNPESAIGEIANRAGAAMFEGYYRNPDATAERIEGATYRSGDLGYRDHDGYFYFAGRGGDWLRVDSENFAAAPVERILARFPGVALVAVYPVPDPRTGDQVMASIQMVTGTEFDPEAFGQFLSGQADLGTKWAPRFVRIVSTIPVTATRKIDKKVLRRESWPVEDTVYVGDTKTHQYHRLDDTQRAHLMNEYELYDRSPA